MPRTVKYQFLIARYKDINNKRYADSKDEKVLGSFLTLPPVGMRARQTRDLKKARNGEGRPKKTITDQVKTSDSFFVKSRKRTKARLIWLWKKEKIKQTLIQLL